MEADALESRFQSGANAYWGLVFKEGNENSRFGEQGKARPTAGEMPSVANRLALTWPTPVGLVPADVVTTLRGAPPREHAALKDLLASKHAARGTECAETSLIGPISSNGV